MNQALKTYQKIQGKLNIKTKGGALAQPGALINAIRSGVKKISNSIVPKAQAQITSPYPYRKVSPSYKTLGKTEHTTPAGLSYTAERVKPTTDQEIVFPGSRMTGLNESSRKEFIILHPHVMDSTNLTSAEMQVKSSQHSDMVKHFFSLPESNGLNSYGVNDSSSLPIKDFGPGQMIKANIKSTVASRSPRSKS